MRRLRQPLKEADGYVYGNPVVAFHNVPFPDCRYSSKLIRGTQPSVMVYLEVQGEAEDGQKTSDNKPQLHGV